MDGDVGVDSQCSDDPLVSDDGCGSGASEVSGTSVGGVAVTAPPPAPPTSSPELTQPITAKLNKLTCDTDDPKPGPSNSAADFDLEVFDSGSSCSNEECWGGEEKGVRKCDKIIGSNDDVAEPTESGHTDLSDIKNLPIHSKISIETESECESETEEMEVEVPGPHDGDKKDVKEDSAVAASDEGVDTTVRGTTSPISVLPSETLDRKESVELWKCETDVIVQDHDVFGTDENDEDSMDSLMLSRDPVPGCAGSRLCRESSLLADHNVVVDGCDSRASSRLSHFSCGDLADIPPLPADQDDSTMSSETIAIENNIIAADLNKAAANEDFERSSPVPRLSSLPSSASSTLVTSSSAVLASAALEDDSVRQTKRKSGSLSEMGLAALPLKKQRPEEPHYSPSETGETSREDDSFELDCGSDMAMICDSNTAPTSPSSPAQPDMATLEPLLTLHPSVKDATMSSIGVGMIPHPAGSPPIGRNLIPDKENPPVEILNWVATFTRWSHAERLLAIDQLIDTCEPQQVRHMMQVIEPQFQRDFISLLPKELALYVLAYLDPKDLLRAAQTCRYWRILAEDNLLWREKSREAGLHDCRETLRRRSKLSSTFLYSPWKAGFMRQHNIEMNWRMNPVKQPKVLKGHDDHVITCLQFSGNRVVSGSDDNTLKVWSAMTGKCLRTLVGHTGGVWSSQMANNVIVSGSTDRTLKVWNAESGTCVHTLYGHTSTVRCMHLHDSKVVSGSRDATLRMWDIDTGECLHVLVGHVAAVRCVQYDGRLVVSGAYDYMVKVWNPNREECLHTLSGHTNRVYSLQFDGVHVVSGSLDTSIRVWDVETGACKHALMGHQSLTSGMELKDNILVSGNADSTVKIWDILTGSCLQTLSGPNKHQSAVTCLQFNNKFVVTSSDDGTVKLWDVKTGEFIRDLVALESGGSGGVVWRIRSSPTKLVCAVGSRNGTEETKLLVLDFDAEVK